MKEEILFSLVMATVGRTEEIRKFLLSVVNLPGIAFEVIVVDQNEDDRLGTIIQSFTKDARVKHIKIKEKNASKARNIGASHATGRWIGFPDDDCVYTPDTLRKVQEVFEQSAPQVVTGTVLDFEGVPLNRFYQKQCQVNLFNLIGKVSEPAFFIRREVFQELKGFNEDFGPGGKNFSSESYELAVRALKQKVTILFDANVQILHPRVMPPYTKAYLTREYGYSYGFGKVLQTHFGTWALFYLAKYLVAFTSKLFRFSGTRKQHAFLTALGLWDGLWGNKPKHGSFSKKPQFLAPATTGTSFEESAILKLR
ncbi:glycosyltransferase family 2 protein [Sabulibacter ruber]|uniref:glycosyltransferase family 2 protein n=1 Tax=Sabulibacter ruber TaxID=2811901 RepID=UPI001A977EC3|nr:glycosyltransferase family 2 protein [Sabulibacter ruber]